MRDSEYSEQLDKYITAQPIEKPDVVCPITGLEADSFCEMCSRKIHTSAVNCCDGCGEIFICVNCEASHKLGSDLHFCDPACIREYERK